MTISSTVGTNMTVDDVVKRAFQTAGIVTLGGTPNTEQTDFGRATLHTQIQSLMAKGIFARWVDFYDLTLTADDYTYSMPTSVVDIVGNGQYIDASETDTTKASAETMVKQMDRERWHVLSAKDSTGRPYLFFADRAVDGDQLEVKLWPIPDEAGTIRFQVHSLPSDTLTGEVTIDLREYWMQYLIWDLAHQIAVASSLPEERCSYLRKVSKEKEIDARSYGNQKVDNRLVLNHPTNANTIRRF